MITFKLLKQQYAIDNFHNYQEMGIQIKKIFYSSSIIEKFNFLLATNYNYSTYPTCNMCCSYYQYEYNLLGFHNNLC